MQLLLQQHAVIFEPGDWEDTQLPTKPVPIRARWLFQVLVALAHARLTGVDWCSLEDLASLNGFRGKVQSAGTKIATYRSRSLGPLWIRDLIIPFEGVQRRGPYALGLPPSALVKPSAEALARYLLEHGQRPVETSLPNPSPGASSTSAPIERKESWLRCLYYLVQSLDTNGTKAAIPPTHQDIQILHTLASNIAANDRPTGDGEWALKQEAFQRWLPPTTFRAVGLLCEKAETATAEPGAFTRADLFCQPLANEILKESADSGTQLKYQERTELSDSQKELVHEQAARAINDWLSIQIASILASNPQLRPVVASLILSQLDDLTSSRAPVQAGTLRRSQNK